jgi:hypothetical protein
MNAFSNSNVQSPNNQGFNMNNNKSGLRQYKSAEKTPLG